MMAQNLKNNGQYYTGTIVEIVDPVLYQIKVDIPGFNKGLSAFPMRNEIDEPRVGDFVLLYSFDPLYNSYFLYQKIKENDFIGFRSNGKMVDITPDYIAIGIFDPTVEYNDKGENYRPELTDWIKLDKDGNLDINLRVNSNINLVGSTKVTISENCEVEVTGNSTVTVSGDSSMDVSGNSTISVGGNCDISVTGSTKLKCPDITVSGPGKLTMSGTTSPGMGPFNCLPNCAFSGVPHGGNMVSTQ